MITEGCEKFKHYETPYMEIITGLQLRRKVLRSEVNEGNESNPLINFMPFAEEKLND
ncbi:MAG TPA: hypothetical protein VHT72_07590 [Puia sp.]|nr:hypothetical protein [Puia sp.]